MKKLLMGLLLLSALAAIGAVVYDKMNKGSAPCCDAGEKCCK